MPVHVLQPARHDHTPPYTERLGALRGGSVQLRLSTSLPVTGVSLKLRRGGEIETHPARELEAEGTHKDVQRWFEFSLPLGERVVRYAWQLELADDHLNLSMSGLHHTRRAFRDWFSYLPGYWAPEWAWSSVFYQIFPDRFRNGDEESDVQTGEYLYAGRPVQKVGWDTPPDRSGDVHAHYGGDLAGVTEALPYLTDLGANALWLTPIFTSPSNHRYDVSDYRSVDPHLGGEAAYEAMLAACHRAGVRVVLDGVFNHVGSEHAVFRAALEDRDAPGRPLFTWREGSELPYHAFMDVPTLPKIDYASPEARREFLDGERSVVRHWLRPQGTREGMDGWRLDVAHMIGSGGGDEENLELHRLLKRAAREENPEAYVFGERFFDAEAALAGDALAGEGEDGAMNYHGFGLPLMQWLSRQTHFFLPSKLDGTELCELLWDAYHVLPPEIALNMFNLLDSHDLPRALYRLGDDKGLLRAGLTLLMGYPGVPCLYYGTEVGLSQTERAAMPFCRAPMPWDEEAWDQELRRDVGALIRLRRTTPALQRGSLRFLLITPDAIGFVREWEGMRVAVLASRRGDGQGVSVTLPPGRWRDALRGEGPDGERLEGRVELNLDGGRVLISDPSS